MTPKERIKAFISQILEATEPESVTNVIVATLLELMQDYTDGADEGLRELVRDEKGDRVRADKELEGLYDGLLGDVTSPQFIGMNPALKGLSDTVNTHSDKINDHEGRITDHEGRITDHSARIAENTLMRDNILPLDELVDVPESSSLFSDGLGLAVDKVVWNTATKRLWGWNSRANLYFSSWPGCDKYGTIADTGAKGVIPAANRILYMVSDPKTLYVKSNTAGLEQLHQATVNRTLANYNHLLAVDRKIGRLEENEADDERRITAVEEVAEMGRTKANAVYEDTKGARFININTFADTDDAFPSLSDALECVPVEYRWHYGTVVTFLYEGMWIVNGKQKRVRKWLWYRWTATAGDEDADWMHTAEWEQLPDESDITTIKKRLDAAAGEMGALNDSRHEVFDDMWLAAVGTRGTIDHTHYDDADADGNRRHTPYCLNTLWLTYEEAVGIYTHSVPTTNTLVCAFSDPPHYRTNLVRNSSGGWGFSLNRAFLRNKVIEVAMVGNGNVESLDYAFYECTSLRRIIGDIDLAGRGIGGTALPYCRCLEEFRFGRLGANADLASCRAVSLESLRYLISKRHNSNTITITVHPDVYAKITDTTNTDWYALLDLAASKNVNIATMA